MTVDVAVLRRVVHPMRRALRSDFVRHGALVFAATMIGNVLNYVFNLAISRRIGVENFATLSSLVSALMILSVPANVLNLIVVKYVSEFHAVDDRAKTWRLTQLLFKWTGVGGAGFLLAGLVLHKPISDFLRIPDQTGVLLCFVLLAISFVTPSIRGLLQGEQEFKQFSASVVLEGFLKVAIGVGLVYAGYGVVGALSGWIAGSAIALGYTLWAVYSHRANLTTPVHLRLDSGRLLKTVAGIALAMGALTVMSFTDVILVKHYFNARQAGLYAALSLTGRVLLFLVGFFPMVLLPKAVATAKRGESPARLLFQAVIGTVAISGPALMVFALLPATVIKLLAGSAFVAAAPYVFEYDVAIAMLAIITLLVNYKIGLHRFRFLYALYCVLAAEAIAISVHHSSLWDVVHILLAGNSAGIAVCLFGLGANKSRASQFQRSEAA